MFVICFVVFVLFKKKCECSLGRRMQSKNANTVLKKNSRGTVTGVIKKSCMPTLALWLAGLDEHFPPKLLFQ